MTGRCCPETLFPMSDTTARSETDYHLAAVDLARSIVGGPATELQTIEARTVLSLAYAAGQFSKSHPNADFVLANLLDAELVTYSEADEVLSLLVGCGLARQARTAEDRAFEAFWSEISKDIGGRRGLKNEWGGVDASTMEEIRAEWRGIWERSVRNVKEASDGS